MKIFNCFILLFVCLFAFLSASADELPKYKMVDLGVFETDSSHALAVNEKGQVLGSCYEGVYQYLFLWDEDTGLTIIELPTGIIHWSLKLNNNGQIAGIIHSNSMHKIVYWDVNSGFLELESSKNRIDSVEFNDKRQILCNIQEQMILLDHGKKIDLTNLFHEQIPGKWSSFRSVSLNNHGHVAFNVYKDNETKQDQNIGEKSFIWKDGSFSMILPEIGWETSVQIQYMDDNGNMIVNLSPKRGGVHGQYFVNQSKNIFIPCQGCEKIRNGVPISRECLPGSLKKDRQGNLYFYRGVQIGKLLKEELPYYNISETAEIIDQNSSGYVVGSVDTMYPGRHAFLAIPKASKNQDECHPNHLK
jgi:hypothetical protein